MCGRFTLSSSPSKLAKHFDLLDIPKHLQPRFNVSPTQEVAVVAQRDTARELSFMRWGLIPHWSEDGKPGPINAKSETIAEKPMFRKAFHERRCLLPATGFYEWTPEGGRKMPSYIHLRDSDLFAFAGIWSRWRPRGKEGDYIYSCCLLTTEPNSLIAKIHDRMPVILSRDDYSKWLDWDTDGTELHSLLKPYPANKMEAWRVSTAVNRPTSQGPELVVPLKV
jgi:putative SOS response-associated peptidase YedK